MLLPFGQARPSLGFPESGELLLLVEFPLEPVDEGEEEEEEEEEVGEEEEESEVADARPEDDPQGSDQDQPESESESDEEDEGLDELDDPATPAVLEPCGTHSELETAAALRPPLSPDVAWWW
ncbi:hypothetical protein MBRA1_003814 [Malassezia brasiliensis]|uniref:Uncharacterized protein n=1 Tax=Malassezia brasiliensis TaxID=1821822 RepID=A0AAF0DX57_9BASI|nr:hypothetical protein MBRA1_003814 [Malassezia brasiliensis]